MKKNKYVSPEMEIIKVEGRYNMLVSTSDQVGDQGKNDGYPED